MSNDSVSAPVPDSVSASAPAAAPPPARPHSGPPPAFSSYQKFVVGMLAFLQFTIILDFMIISPLGAILLRDLHLPTKKFGLVVSVYAFSAALSGLLAAGFADRFDRKKLLLFFYAGFTGALSSAASRRPTSSCSPPASSPESSAASSARSRWRSSPTSFR